MVAALNHDVLEHVIAHVDRSTLYSVCLVSHALDHIGRRYLYEDISVRAERAFVLFYTFIYAQPAIGLLVRSYTELSSLNNVIIPAWSVERFRMLSQALATMDNLRHLRLRTPVRDIFSAGRGGDFARAVAGMVSLSSLMLHSVPATCSTLFSAIRANLTSLAVQGLVNDTGGPPCGLAQLLYACRRTLVTFRISTVDVSRVLQLEQTDAVWPNVETLDISFCTADARLADAFPHLRTLVARDSILPVAGLLCAPSAWPQLQTLVLSHDFDVLEDAEFAAPRVLDTFQVLEGRDTMFAGPHYEHLQDVLSVVACDVLRHLTVCSMPWLVSDARRLSNACHHLESLAIHCDGMHAVSIHNLSDGLHSMRRLKRFSIIYRYLQRSLAIDLKEGFSVEVLHLGRVVPTLREARLQSWAGDPAQSLHWRWFRDEVVQHWTFEPLAYEFSEDDLWLD